MSTPSENAYVSTGQHCGQVVSTTGTWQIVLSRGERIPCRVRGKFRLRSAETTHPVAVGDQVMFQLESDGTGVIVDLESRRSSLSRKAAGKRKGVEHVIAANLDRVWIIQALKRPRYNSGFIDRVLVMAEYGGVESGIVFNKMDQEEPGSATEDLEYLVTTYGSLGYPVVKLSAITGQGVAELASLLAGKLSAVVGPSGVGKSTLLNAIQPGLGLRTSEVSDSTNKGRHTTASSSLHELDVGGGIVDTPGVREFGLLDIEPTTLSAYFREIRPLAAMCGYANCVHDHEPDCAVKQAVDEGSVSEARFLSYLSMLDSLSD